MHVCVLRCCVPAVFLVRCVLLVPSCVFGVWCLMVRVCGVGVFVMFVAFYDEYALCVICGLVSCVLLSFFLFFFCVS